MKLKLAIVLALVGVFVVGHHLMADGRWIVGDVVSYNHETYISNAQIYTPKNIEELQNVVKEAFQKDLKVKAIGASHSTNSIIASDGFYVRTSAFNKILGLEKASNGEMWLSVEGGAKTRDISNYLSQKGYALGFAYPFYGGVTIAGLLGTCAHGSSRRHTAVSSQNVREVSLVDGTGQLRTLTEADGDLFRAARCHLGLLGIIHSLKIKVIPNFNIKYSSVVLEKETALLRPDGKVNWGPEYDSEYMQWFPIQNIAVKHFGVITDEPAMPGAELTVLGADNSNQFEQQTIRKLLTLAKHNSTVAGMIEKVTRDNVTKNIPFIYRKDGQVAHASTMVGPSDKMLMNIDTPLGTAYTIQDLSFSFAAEDAGPIFEFIRSFSIKKKYYYPFMGIFLRFAKSDPGVLLSHAGNTAGHDGVYVFAEFGEVKDFGANATDTKSGSVKIRNELMYQLITKYNVRLHWGKNTDQIWGFTSLKNQYGDKMTRFKKQAHILDPKGIFQNSFSRKFIGGNGY